ncbi:MAG: 2-phospho-L-lactate transferase [Acidimicrobiia bacterium]|nr:2-phospho-L-lactate transferase [Acidimicrobiia bacterium]
MTDDIVEDGHGYTKDELASMSTSTFGRSPIPILPRMQIALLSGGVGGARMARSLRAAGASVTVVVNVGDDEEILGLDISPDLDTVMYTLAGVEGAPGWGVDGDSTRVMDALERLGGDTRFTLGDQDLGTHLARTSWRRAGIPLSEVTRRLCTAHGLTVPVLPATDGRLRTQVQTDDGWLSFQEYFVYRRHADPVRGLRFVGAEATTPAPGVIEALDDADVILFGPSNPPLSIWPILAVPGISDSVADHRRVVAVSPLFGGKALKGPADKVLTGLGLPPGNEGVVAAYEGLLSDLVVDTGDAHDRHDLAGPDLRVHVADTHIADPARAKEFGQWLLELLSN